MVKILKLGWWFLTAALIGMAQPSIAAQDPEGLQGRLASVAWLEKNRARADVVILDASPASLYKQQHIPGAIQADLFSFGHINMPLAQLEKRLRSWGISPGQQIVIVDQGGTWMATKLFWDLVHHGLPADSLFILDGGMARWKADGGAMSKDPTPAPQPGTVRVTAQDQAVRVKLPEFLAATGDPDHNVMLEALDPEYFFGAAAFFNRGGHVPHATLMPAADFYNPDKTFKSPQEMQRMLDHLGVKPEQQIHTYCGGGGAAAVPFFALKFMLNYPRVKLFQESQLGWLQDERELPVWTYGTPHLTHDVTWLKAWGSPMLKAFGLSKVSIVDVRAAETFKLGHVPLAINLPALASKGPVPNAEQLAALLGQAGVPPANEAVVVSEGGLNESAALAFLMLENLGQHKVSIFLDSLERWAELGLDVARPADAASAGRPAQAPPAQAPAYTAKPRSNLLVADPKSIQGLFPKVYIASGRKLPARTPEGRVIHLPYAQFLTADGTPKPAKDIWLMLSKAGVPRYAELVLYADTLGEAAVNYVVFRMMGFADVKVWAL